jgi:putative Ca2+/H+ antiporter (TMEM165/GDT1 family)
MDAFIQSCVLVALSEMGDKTQILSLMLSVRYKQPWTIMAAILVATLANHAGATWFGSVAASHVPEVWLKSGLALLFIVFGLWLLKPDSDEGLNKDHPFGAFFTTLIVFFLAEMGDKTQLATVALGARYQSVMMVTAGSTVGMLVTNALSVFGGEKLISVIPMSYVRIGACVLFIIFGVALLPIWPA